MLGGTRRPSRRSCPRWSSASTPTRRASCGPTPSARCSRTCSSSRPRAARCARASAGGWARLPPDEDRRRGASARCAGATRPRRRRRRPESPRAWVVTADMGLGHQRAAHALAHLAHGRHPRRRQPGRHRRGRGPLLAPAHLDLRVPVAHQRPAGGRRRALRRCWTACCTFRRSIRCATCRSPRPATRSWTTSSGRGSAGGCSSGCARTGCR